LCFQTNKQTLDMFVLRKYMFIFQSWGLTLYFEKIHVYYEKIFYVFKQTNTGHVYFEKIHVSFSVVGSNFLFIKNYKIKN
jgi:hypothetical protein